MSTYIEVNLSILLEICPRYLGIIECIWFWNISVIVKHGLGVVSQKKVCADDVLIKVHGDTN